MSIFGPSEHIKWEELACKDGTEYPNKFVQQGIANQLANMFEDIRAMYDLPIIILSAYRTKNHNLNIGGANNSQHMHGRALDLRAPKGLTVEQFYQDIKHNTSKFGITGLGRYPTFVHVDIRVTGKLVAWKANGLKDDKITTIV